MVYAMSSDNVFALKAFQAETGTDKLQFLQDFNTELSGSVGKTFDGFRKRIRCKNRAIFVIC